MLSLLSSCPACLGLLGSSFLSLDYLPGRRINLQADYTYLRQSEGEYFRSLNVGGITVLANLMNYRLSVGLRTPIFLASGFMRDRKFHRVQSVFGVDVLARYLVFREISPSRPTIYLLFSFKFPVGYLYHEEHESVDIPIGLTGGIGGSRFISGSWQVSGEAFYSYYLQAGNYNFGDKALITAGVSRFISLPDALLSFYVGSEISYAEGDIGLEPNVEKNTGYIYYAVRFGIGLVKDNFRLYPSFFGVPFYKSEGDMSLPVRFGFSIRTALGI